ncbi:predicted protein [Histoplasma mississippiense (nom. inval.)]|uniref:predicted protein n=1 Tax=Ajellomyces capsulatus (strain NAm1 / WU24) TaxID=2059318 RepID=UPI000157D172|nr:predicted protein [Histoplasma mississippiense (nom. inval.)]EDN11311.1 predicted protein [Histoplasma mississippiense (nom. inval.)]
MDQGSSRAFFALNEPALNGVGFTRGARHRRDAVNANNGRKTVLTGAIRQHRAWKSPMRPESGCSTTPPRYLYQSHNWSFFCWGGWIGLIRTLYTPYHHSAGGD